MTEDKGDESGPTPDQSEANPAETSSEAAASTEQANPALALITAFGGIRPMAGKLAVAVSTVQGWKERGVIPANRHDQIRAAAKEHGIELDPALLSASDQAEAPAAEEASADGSDDDRPSKTDDGDQAATPAATTPAASPIPASRPGLDRPPPAGHGWVPPFLLGALIMAVGAVLAILTVDLWGPRGGGDDDGKLAALESQVAQLSGTLDKLSAADDGSADLKSQLDKLAGAESALTARINKLEQQADQPAASPDELADLSRSSKDMAGQMSALQTKLAELDRLDKEVAALSSSLDAKRALAAGEVAKLLAVERLRSALDGSAPYSVALTHLKTSLGSDPAVVTLLGPLEAHATQGLPSVAELRLQFPAVAKAIVAAGDGAEDDDGMMSGVWNRLRNVVSVRPVGPAEGGSPGAIAARAEVALEAGDLAGAVKQLDSLSGKATGAAADWLAQAKARVAAEDALAAVSDQLVVQLTGAGG